MTELIAAHLQTAMDAAMVWGPLLILFFMAVESSFIPFPSEVVMIPAGFLAARHGLWPGDPLAACVVAVLCGILGSLAGAIFNYYFALWLGRPLLYRYGKYFFLKPDVLERSEEVFREYGEVATFVCRLIPVIRQVISVPAGLARMHFGRFLLFTGLGAGIWVIILTAAGYAVGHSTREMNALELVHAGKAMVARHWLWLALGLVAVVVGYGWVHRRVMQRSLKAAPAAAPANPPAPPPAAK